MAHVPQFCITTKFGYKLANIAEFASKFDSRIDWVVRDGVLSGSLLCHEKSAIAVVQFKFEEYTSGCIHFSTLVEPFLCMLANTNKNELLVIEFFGKIENVDGENRLHAQNLDIVKHMKSGTSRCSIPLPESYGIRDLYIDHVDKPYVVDAKLFAKTIREIGKNDVIKLISSSDNPNKLTIKTDIYSCELVNISNPNNYIVNNVDIETSRYVLLPWKKALSNMCQEVEISISETNMCIFTTSEDWFVKMCWRKV